MTTDHKRGNNSFVWSRKGKQEAAVAIEAKS